MSNKLFLSTNGIKIQLLGNSETLDSFNNSEQLLKSIIPELKIESTLNEIPFQYTIELRRGNKPKLLVLNNSVLYEYATTEIDLKAFGYTILTNIISQLLLKMNKLIIHSSVIDINGKGYALFGKGKTSSVISLGNYKGVKIIAEDNAILNLENFNVSGELISFNVYNEEVKQRIISDDLDLKIGTHTSLKTIFHLTNFYDSENFVELSGFAKSSIVCSFVNERLFNHSRWNTELEMVPDLKIYSELESKRNSIVKNLINSLEVVGLKSTIKNYPKLIKDYLKL